MKCFKMKNVALTVLWIFLVGWLLFFWGPMIRNDFDTFDDTETVIRNSKTTLERVKLEIKRIEQKTPPRLPQAPDGDGLIH